MIDCITCARKGILIYPVRYAIACPGGAANVPGLTGRFKIEKAPTDMGNVKYTLRAMRSGYMYMYDEQRKRLKGYLVSPNGYLQNFPIDQEPRSMNSNRVAICTNPDEMVFMRCLDIVHKAGDEATNIWVGWSSIVWTKDSIVRVSDSAWREKHMQCINVPAMLAGTATHTGEFSANYKKIANFSADKDEMRKAFAFSNTSVTEEVRYSGVALHIKKIMEMHAPYNKGFIVALNDPVGIVNDLSELMLPSTDAGFDEDIARGKLVYDMLTLTERSLREDAKRSVILDDKIHAPSPDHPKGTAEVSLWQIIKAGGHETYEARVAADKAKYGDQQTGRQNAAADHAWEDVITEERDGKRVALLDQARIKAFPAIYDQAIKDFEHEGQKIAWIHAEWLASDQLANWMEGVHDSKDIRSGFAYSESLAQCIGKGVVSKHCSEQLKRWLSNGAASDPRNLYSRALLFNHEDLINASEAGLKGSDIQYENILNIYKMALIKLDAGMAAKLMDRLALTTANVLIDVLKDTAYSIAKYKATTHLTILSGASVTTTVSSAAELGEWAFANAKMLNIPLVGGDFEARLAAQRTAIKLISDEDPRSFSFGIREDIVASNGGITERSIVKRKIPGFDQTKRWLGSSVPREFHLGSATAIIQMFALVFIVKDMKNADQFNSQERYFKGGAAMIGLSMSLVDMVATTASINPAHPIAGFLKQQWARSTRIMRNVAKGAQVIGAITGFVTSGYDLYNSLSSFRDGKRLLGGLYLVNGILGMAVAVAGYFMLPIFWPFLVISIIVGIVIAFVSSGALQEWVSRCYFSGAVSRVRAMTKGRAPFKPYPYTSADQECAAFKSAMGV